MEKKLRVVIIVQARMSSTRLPGKVLKLVLDRPILSYLIERLRQVKLADELVIATSDQPEDEPIVTLCNKAKVHVVRGSLNDVLARYAKAAAESDADAIVRICSDCPLIDPTVVDEAISFYLQHYPKYSWVCNAVERRYPRGYEVEVFSREALDIAAEVATDPDEREHVTPYLYRHPERFGLGSVVGNVNLGNERWVLDTPEDFALISRILTDVYPDRPEFRTDDIVACLREHPEWRALNSHVPQNKVSGFPGERDS